jgi:hypothetical protein
MCPHRIGTNARRALSRAGAPAFPGQRHRHRLEVHASVRLRSNNPPFGRTCRSVTAPRPRRQMARGFANCRAEQCYAAVAGFFRGRPRRRAAVPSGFLRGRPGPRRGAALDPLPVLGRFLLPGGRPRRRPLGVSDEPAALADACTNCATAICSPSPRLTSSESAASSLLSWAMRAETGALVAAALRPLRRVERRRAVLRS